MSKIYAPLRFALLGWAALALIGHIGYWLQAGFGWGVGFVRYEDLAHGADTSALAFLIDTATLAVFVAALFQGYVTVGRLRTVRENWARSARDLRLLAVLLLAATLAQFVADILVYTLREIATTGEPALALVLDFPKLSTVLIALIVYLAARALDQADEAVEENKQFL